MILANAISEGLSRDNALVHRANWQSGTRNMVRMLRSAPAYEFDSGNNHGVVSPPRVSASAPAGAKDDTASYYDWRKAEIMLRPRAYEVHLHTFSIFSPWCNKLMASDNPTRFTNFSMFLL